MLDAMEGNLEGLELVLSRMSESLKEIEYNERKMPVLARQTGTDSPADVTLLDYQVEYDLTDAHNWTERHHVTKKVLTYKGKKDNAELKLDYNPVWEDVKAVLGKDLNGLSKAVDFLSKEEGPGVMIEAVELILAYLRIN